MADLSQNNQASRNLALSCKKIKKKLQHTAKLIYPVEPSEKKCATERFFKSKMREGAEKRIIDHLKNYDDGMVI